MIVGAPRLFFWFRSTQPMDSICQVRLHYRAFHVPHDLDTTRFSIGVFGLNRVLNKAVLQLLWRNLFSVRGL